MALSPDLLSASSNLLCPEDAGDVASWDPSAATAADDEWAPPCPAAAAAAAAAGLVDGRSLAALLAVEAGHAPPGAAHFVSRPLLAAARNDAVKWILKVNEFYRFRAATAYLSVTYLDRFLSSHSIPALEKGVDGSSGGWPMQLVSVACVSVAAKMEEVRVPSLLDLQILGPGYVFDPSTVRRMELLLMAAIGWRMRAVTPFDFLPYLSAAPCLLARAAGLVLSALRVVDFLSFRPSEIAAASALCAADDAADASAGSGGELSSRSAEWTSKEAVSRCRRLMDDYLLDACPSASRSKPDPPCSASASPLGPPSAIPVAILDADADAASGGSSSNSYESAAPADEPQPKRRRHGGNCTESLSASLHGLPPRQ